MIYPSSTATTGVAIDAAANEDTTTVASLQLAAYGRIHVNDTRPPAARGNYNDVSQVDKYEMSAADYESRGDSVLAWKKQNHLGRFSTSAGPAQQSVESADAELRERGIAVGRRCRLLNAAGSADAQERRGEIRFVGEVKEIKGSAQRYWVGVELDEPLGKNDGTIHGTRYFTAKPNHGSLVKPANVEVGDFPELDLFADDDEEL